ncbi:MAG: DUF5318 family protein [Ferrimicrobium sp.]
MSGPSVGRVVDHRLMRARTLRDLNRGDIQIEDVCDASAELERAAHNFGRQQSDRCPICGQCAMVEVRFAFGRGLPANGQVVGGTLVERSFKRIADLTIFDVEVCLACRWNHLLRQVDPEGNSAGRTLP